MAIGVLGLPLELAVQVAEEELRLAPDFATTQHLPTVGPSVQEQVQRVALATQLLVEQANKF